MPFPIKPGSAARRGPKIILERPKIAALIGAIAAEWGDVDELLLCIFNYLTFAKPIPVGAHSSSPLSAAIFGKFVSTGNKCEMIDSLLALRAPSKRDEFALIKSDLLSKSRERGTLVHSAWSVCDDYPEDLIFFGKNGEWIKYTEKCFSASLDRFSAVRASTQDFFIGLSHTKLADPE